LVSAEVSLSFRHCRSGVAVAASGVWNTAELLPKVAVQAFGVVVIAACTMTLAKLVPLESLRTLQAKAISSVAGAS